MNSVDYKQMTAPCGLDCFNCNLNRAVEDEVTRRENMKLFNIPYEAAVCRGCRSEDGLVPVRRLYGMDRCKVYRCVSAKGIESCADCSDFPCDNLHPYAENAALLPHNIKIYNLALIRKMGLERWANEKARQVRETYFYHPFEI